MARALMTEPAIALIPNRQLPPLSRLALTLAQFVVTWEARRIGRRALRALDPHLLRDIGLSEQSATAEAEKPFWQA